MAFSARAFEKDYTAVGDGTLTLEEFKNKYDFIPEDFKYTSNPIGAIGFLAQKLNGAKQSINFNKLASQDSGTDTNEFKELFKQNLYVKTVSGEDEDEEVIDEDAFLRLAKNIIKYQETLNKKRFEELETLIDSKLSVVSEDLRNQFDIESLKADFRSDMEKMIIEKSPTLLQQSTAQEKFKSYINHFALQSYYQNPELRKIISTEQGKTLLDNWLNSASKNFEEKLSKNPNLQLSLPLIERIASRAMEDVTDEYGLVLEMALPKLDVNFNVKDYDSNTFEPIKVVNQENNSPNLHQQPQPKPQNNFANLNPYQNNSYQQPQIANQPLLTDPMQKEEAEAQPTQIFIPNSTPAFPTTDTNEIFAKLRGK
jgi:hypothetical protein